ncbi:MAG: hypothetical protein KF883_15245 [Thermomicrobiales bacterium]|nr:hypothetical protein [Thermomicrobiales bacterium]
MLTFVQAHASIDFGQIDAESLASMQEPRSQGGAIGPVIVDATGAGWMLLDIDGETVLMSQGGDAGLISAMVAAPGRKFGMVVLANCDTALTLVNDAVLYGLATFLDLSRPESEPYTLTEDEAMNAEGQYGLPEWITFVVSPETNAMRVAALAGGEEIADFSGDYTMTSATHGFKPFLGGKLWIELVRDDTGEMGWLRFIGRLLPKN